MQVRTLTAVNQIGHEDHPPAEHHHNRRQGRDDGEQGHHVRHQKQQQRADQHAEAGEQQAAHRNAGTARQDTKLPVRMLLHRQAVQHAGAGEDAAVGRGHRRGQRHEVNHRRGRGQPGFGKQRYEGAGLRRHPRPGGDSDDHHHRQQIEDDNPQRQSIDRLGQNALRIAGLRRHGAQQLNAGKGEDRYLEAGEKAGDAVGHKGRRVGEMAEGGRHAVRGGPAGGNHPAAGADQGDNGDHLDQGEPELRLAKHFHRQQVKQEQDRQHAEGRHPCRQFREPVLHIAPADHHVGDTGHHPA